MTSAQRNTILIIDDEPANIVTIRHMLSSEHTIYGVTDGMSGITAAKLQKPDLILLDIIMPEMDGYKVLAQLKATKETQHIPVIIITQLNSDESEEKGLMLGAEDYIHKPFSSLTVKLRIQNALKVVNRNKVINEQLQHQTLLKTISQSFFTEKDSNSLVASMLRMTGEKMGLAQVLFYVLDKDSPSLICRNEWIDHMLNPETCIGDKLEFNDVMMRIMNDLRYDNGGDLCLNSNNPYHKEVMKPYRKNSYSFITAPVFYMGKVNAAIDFSREDENLDWNENEINFAVIVASIFTKYFER